MSSFVAGHHGPQADSHCEKLSAWMHDECEGQVLMLCDMEALQPGPRLLVRVLKGWHAIASKQSAPLPERICSALKLQAPKADMTCICSNLSNGILF